MKTEYKIALIAVVLGVACAFVVQAMVVATAIDWLNKADHVIIHYYED